MLKPGATYTVRTASALAGKILPKDCVFSHNAQTWQDSDLNSLLASIAYMCCRVPQTFIELGVGGGDIATSGSVARRYTTAVVEGVPIQNIEILKDKISATHIKNILDAKLIDLSFDETSADYRSPLILQEGSSVAEITRKVIESINQAKHTALYSSFEIDNLVTKSFTLDKFEEDFVNNEVGVHPCIYDADPNYQLLNELVTLEEKALINKAVEIHGAQRYFTKKSFFCRSSY